MDRAELAEILRVERARRGFRLREASRASGLSPSVISDMERVRRDPRWDSVQALLGAYGMQIEVVSEKT